MSESDAPIWRPICQTAPLEYPGLKIAAGWTSASSFENLRGAGFVGVASLPKALEMAFSAEREPIAAVAMDRPRIMGILNVTPDSFSDGGRFTDLDLAVARAKEMVSEGADILDIGGESTRPGAHEVSASEEIARVVPVIKEIRAAGLNVPISIDTRKAEVAAHALAVGANMVNDVSAMMFDPEMAAVVADADCPVCLMHALGTPETMQDDPRYSNVVAEVYTYLAERISAAQGAGIAAHRIVVDPGIGFGKKQEHIIALLRAISALHGLGCPILLGASRKRFIGAISQAGDAGDRMAGSVAVALHAVTQGVQILRVHDIQETKAAVAMQMALMRTSKT